MNKRVKVSFVLVISMMLISSIFYFLLNSQYLTINKIEITVNQGDVPPSIVSYLQEYKNQNIFRVDTNKIRKYLNNNAFIESSKVKITIKKNMVINLNKNQVDAIIKTIGDEKIALLCKNNIYEINDVDKSLIDNNLLEIDMDNQVLYSLIYNEKNEKFDKFKSNIDLLNQYCYLISSVKYDNNVNNSFGFFKLELNIANMEIRFRDEVNSIDIKKAIDFAQSKNVNVENELILDVYHGAIVERNRPLGG